jgi:hypothetical protein
MLSSLLKRPLAFRLFAQNVRFASTEAHVFEKIKLNKADGEATADDFRKKVGSIKIYKIGFFRLFSFISRLDGARRVRNSLQN